MTECRFFPECVKCNDVGESWFPCKGGAYVMRCAGYTPMPDIDALMALANEISREAMEGKASTDLTSADIFRHFDYARRIREALGAQDG